MAVARPSPPPPDGHSPPAFEPPDDAEVSATSLLQTRPCGLAGTSGPLLLPQTEGGPTDSPHPTETRQAARAVGY